MSYELISLKDWVCHNDIFVTKKSIRVHFAPAEIAITLELLSQFLRFLDQNDRHSLGVLLIY